tara:strand:+ start:323 stop:1351 length:1029 start_codon:yes stop_codon:yes gene_type:complete
MAEKDMQSFHGTGSGTPTIKQAIETYEALAPQKRTLDEGGREKLSTAIGILMPKQQFITLSTDPEYAGIHSRLFDAVHEPKNPEDLMGRLGEFGTNKLAMAMAVQDEDGQWFPTAVVYTYWSDQADLPSQIRPILDEPIRDLNGSPKVIVPYTISSNFPKAGDSLIAEVHNHVYETLGLDDAVLATLSPLRAGKRGFATWLQEQGVSPKGGSDQILPHAFDYLMPVNHVGDRGFMPKDAVQSFHMAGKGAMLGAIHSGNDDSARDMELAHGFMANYIYVRDLEEMAQNRTRFREEGLVTVTSELAEQIPEQYQDRLYVQNYDDDSADPQWDQDYAPDGLSPM